MNKNQKQNCKGLCVVHLNIRMQKLDNCRVSTAQINPNSRSIKVSQDLSTFFKARFKHENMKNLSVWGLKKAFKLKLNRGWSKS